MKFSKTIINMAMNNSFDELKELLAVMPDFPQNDWVVYNNTNTTTYVNINDEVNLIATLLQSGNTRAAKILINKLIKNQPDTNIYNFLSQLSYRLDLPPSDWYHYELINWIVDNGRTSLLKLPFFQKIFNEKNVYELIQSAVENQDHDTLENIINGTDPTITERISHLLAHGSNTPHKFIENAIQQYVEFQVTKTNIEPIGVISTNKDIERLLLPYKLSNLTFIERMNISPLELEQLIANFGITNNPKVNIGLRMAQIMAAAKSDDWSDFEFLVNQHLTALDENSILTMVNSLLYSDKPDHAELILRLSQQARELALSTWVSCVQKGYHSILNIPGTTPKQIGFQFLKDLIQEKALAGDLAMVSWLYKLARSKNMVMIFDESFVEQLRTQCQDQEMTSQIIEKLDKLKNNKSRSYLTYFKKQIKTMGNYICLSQDNVELVATVLSLAL